MDEPLFDAHMERDRRLWSRQNGQAPNSSSARSSTSAPYATPEPAAVD